jgi:hypothetical protein
MSGIEFGCGDNPQKPEYLGCDVRDFHRSGYSFESLGLFIAGFGFLMRCRVDAPPQDLHVLFGLGDRLDGNTG